MNSKIQQLWRKHRAQIESKVGDAICVYGDLNKLDGDELSLDTFGTVTDLAHFGLKLAEGMSIPMWSDDADDNDNFDPILFTGILRRRLDGVWYAQVNREELIHFSKMKR